MVTYEKDLWRPIVARLLSLHRKISPEQFLADHGLTNSMRLDLVEHQDEDRRKGLTVEVIYRLCEKADISPTWLLFGAGKRNLGAIKESQTMKKKIGARLMQLIEGLPLDARREAKQNLRELLDDDTPGEVQTGNKNDAGANELRKAPARPKSH